MALKVFTVVRVIRVIRVFTDIYIHISVFCFRV
jgi:hypothetical protein